MSNWVQLSKRPVNARIIESTSSGVLSEYSQRAVIQVRKHSRVNSKKPTDFKIASLAATFIDFQESGSSSETDEELYTPATSYDCMNFLIYI